MSLTRASAAVIKTEELVNNRNKIINGAMEIAQRGNTFTNQATTSSPNGPYTLDRWMNNRNSDVPGLTVTQSTDAPEGFINSMRIQRASGNTSNASAYVFYTMAREDAIPLAGKTVTLSFYAKAGANYSAPANTITLIATTTTTDSDTKVYLFSPSTTVKSQVFTLTTSWQRFSTTFTLGSTIKQFGFYVITGTGLDLVGTAGADDSWYWTGVQLEEGSVATPFERRPRGTELALCQRYYFRETPGIANVFLSGSAYFATTTIAYQSTQYPVPLRVAPTALEQTGTAGNYNLTYAGGTQACSAVPTFLEATPFNAVTTFTVSSGLTAGQASRGRVNTTTAYLGWSAEL
jgi:hypothetical protein